MNSKDFALLTSLSNVAIANMKTDREQAAVRLARIKDEGPGQVTAERLALLLVLARSATGGLRRAFARSTLRLLADIEKAHLG